MTIQPSPAAPAGATIELAPARATERRALLSWLDAGLRDARLGRIEAEYPTALAPGRECNQIVAKVAGSFAAHALCQRVTAHADGLDVSLGLIGLVYTDPRWRGRGIASRCVEACVQRLVSEGAQIIALWSELSGLYEPLGFQRAGTEWTYTLDAALCRAAGGSEARRFEISAPTESDWYELERLYSEKPSHVQREAGVLRQLAATPDLRIRVARRHGHPAAYVCEGKGDDLQGFAHEWAGDPYGVLACLEVLSEACGTLHWVTGSLDEAPAPQLRAAGARRTCNPLAWMFVPDLPALWRIMAAGSPALATMEMKPTRGGFVLTAARGSVPLSERDAVSLLLGPDRPARIAAVLSSTQYLALRRRLPWPLYLWGLDSI